MEDFWDNTCVEGERRGGGESVVTKRVLRGTIEY